MNYINDISILLTQKIEHDLVHEFAHKGSVPTFRNIRETIFKTLTEYIQVYFSEEFESEAELAQLSEKMLVDIKNHKLERAACEFALQILQNEEVIHKFVYESDKNKDNYSTYKNTTKYIPVIKLQKLLNETDDDYFKGRF